MNSKQTEEMKRILRLIILLLGFAVLGATASAAEPVRIEASLDRDTMTTDDAAVLELEVQADRQVTVELPEIDGLRFRPRGQSSRMEMVNGHMTTTLSQVILVYADQPGDYTIPPIKAKAGSDEFETEDELTLKVSQGAGRAASPSQRAPTFTPGSQAAKVTAGKPGDLAFLEVAPGKTESVVGEVVPVEVHAYFRAGERISLRSQPKVQGGAFTIRNQDGEPKQERVSVGGVPYTRLTFYAGIAAAKPGEFPVEVALDATVVVREKGNGRNPMKDMRSRMGSIFDDPFFSDDLFDDFFGRLVEKEVDLVSDPIAFTVTELPTKDRPTGFAGAVGKFTIHATAKEAAVETGDPVTVKVAVEGTGNFDRVTMPTLISTDGWKVYSASSEFVSGDSIGQSGVKLFEQVLVPLTPDITEVPVMELAFFDPESESFEVARTEPVPLKVTGEAVAPEPATPAVVDSVEKSEGRITDPAAAGSADITPLYARPWFVLSQVGMLAVILLGFGILLARRWRSDPERRLRKHFAKEVDQAVAAMDQAITRNDVTAFFASVRRLAQWHVSQTFGLAPAAVTASDAPDPATREILTTADAVAFSGRTVPADELPNWKERVLQLIEPKS